MMQSIQTLKLTKTKELAFTAMLTFLAVATPMLIHFVSGVDGGRKFLPMPFFVLLAGLILGWRAGILTALMSVIVSYLLTGMPMLNILPIIIIQISALGFVAGVAIAKYKNAWLSIALAIIASWIAMGVAVFFFSNMPVMKFVASSIRDGYIGYLLQIAILPIIAVYVSRKLADEKEL